jgi:uncharacterized membrane protein YdjX (TVP38/TMEM64 family)
VSDYLILFLIVLGVNLMPAFGPPTWLIIVLYGLNTDLRVPSIVLVGALAASLGRFLLAHAFRLLRNRLTDKTQRNLAVARDALERRRRNVILGLGLFALSPVPSAQLFEVAGLAGVRLLGFTAAFFVGRTISYSIYALSASGVRETSIGEIFREALTSPLGIALQVVMIGLLVLLARVYWGKYLDRDPERAARPLSL